jgi:hypothetical protein
LKLPLKGYFTIAASVCKAKKRFGAVARVPSGNKMRTRAQIKGAPARFF